MPNPYKGLQRLGKVGRIFVPDSFLKREEKKLEEQQRTIKLSPGGIGRRRSVHARGDGGREAHRNKMAAKRHRARKIATASRRRNRGT